MIQRLPVLLPAFDNNNIPICLQSSEKFAPYASVVVLSILNHISEKYNYDIIVTTWDMSSNTRNCLVAMASRDNVRIRVVNIRSLVKKYENIAKKSSGYNRFSYTGVARLILPEYLQSYKKIINLDCDLLVKRDIADLFNHDVSNVCAGGGNGYGRLHGE